jgi:predicted transglutaminase-like cysteine proteinase
MISSYEGRGSLPYRPENDPYTPTYQKPLPFGALKSDGRTVLLAEGGLKETMKAIQDATRASIPQTKELAQRLKAETDEQTFYNIWHFLKTNLKYKLDKNGMEQVRTAARSLADRNKGIDCEDFSIFAYALLINLGYKPKFEIVAFNGKKEFGHIYVIVNGYTIDAVMDLFNKKPKNITKTKHMDIHSLTGVDGYDLGATPKRSNPAISPP